MMNQEIQDDEVTIDLMELFSALWAKKTIIILSAVFMALVAFVGTKMFVTPKYTSVTKLFVMTKNDDTSASATYTDLQTGSMLTKDYMELVKSRPVLEKTISKLKLDVTPEELAEMITTETPTDTRIMSISVTDDDPKEAKQIADTLRKAVSVQITEIMSADSVNTVEEGNLLLPSSSAGFGGTGPANVTKRFGSCVLKITSFTSACPERKCVSPFTSPVTLWRPIRTDFRRSASTNRTLLPPSARDAASPIVTVLFPSFGVQLVNTITFLSDPENSMLVRSVLYASLLR